MEDLLGALLQGSQTGSGSSMGQGDTDPLAQLLQGLSGGQSGFSAGTSQVPGGGAGGLGDILTAIMGGGSSAMQSNSLLAPIVDALAAKLNIPPQLAQAVVAFVLGKLLGGRELPGTAGSQAYTPPAATPTQGPGLDAVVRKMNRGQRVGMASPSRAANLEEVVQRMNSGQRVRKTDVRGTGLGRELAAHTGLDRATAEAGVQEVLNALAGELGTAPSPRPSDTF